MLSTGDPGSITDVQCRTCYRKKKTRQKNEKNKKKKKKDMGYQTSLPTAMILVGGWLGFWVGIDGLQLPNSGTNRGCSKPCPRSLPLTQWYDNVSQSVGNICLGRCCHSEHSWAYDPHGSRIYRLRYIPGVHQRLVRAVFSLSTNKVARCQRILRRNHC